MSVLIIAEIGSVHDGSFGNALKLVDAAAECGVDAVKFQTHIAEAESIRNAPSPPYFTGEPRFEYFNRTSFKAAQWKQLKKHCESAGVSFLSSPFSCEAVQLLEDVGVDSYKIASGEVTNLLLLETVAKTSKPIFLSTGMSSWTELDRAVATIRAHNEKLTILQCTSEYPCPPERVGLNVLAELRHRYGLPVGFSDHSEGIWAALAAVTLGAGTIEKHLTFSRKMYGSDAPYATEPALFSQLVEGVRAIETILSSPVDKNDLARFADMKKVFEKSVVALVDLSPGAVITAEMIACKKPGTGISASEFNNVIGRRLQRPVKADSPIQPGDLEN